jgi:hypothetical protein
MNIVGIRILPPLAIGRLGASSTPLESYDLQVAADDPLGFRRIVGRTTLEVSAEQGDIVRQYRPQKIRLRFTPAKGFVYGASKERKPSADATPEPDPVFEGHPERIVYDKTKPWFHYAEAAGPGPIDPRFTNPAQIFAGYYEGGAQVSWGYLDDECDGIVSVRIDPAKTGGVALEAFSRIGAGPPAFAPDSLPIRTVADELEQVLLGPSVDAHGVRIEEALEIVRRAFESVRLMNTAVMNGNPVDGRVNVASTMVRQDTNDTGRRFEPIAAASLVDTLAILALHERVYTALRSGTAPWFESLLRRPEEIGDLTDEARRKMPALMRGADGRYLTLTRRQIDTVAAAARGALFDAPPPEATPKQAERKGVSPRNLTAQLHHRSVGNPVSTLPSTAISNCFPGLEFDFRNVWRRVFEEITLIENNNYVLAAAESHRDLIGHRLLRIDGFDVVTTAHGPYFPNGDPTLLVTQANPHAVAFMEWSNSLGRVLHGKQGQKVRCHFTAEPSEVEVPSDGGPTAKVIERELTLRHFFEGSGTEQPQAVIARALLEPGELTQGLCSPWQNDYRECACYYWAASRPDYVNVTPTDEGLSRGDNWMQKRRTGEYLPDDRSDSRLLSYDDLFTKWEEVLAFQVRGTDADVVETTRPRDTDEQP